ncbi:uncharacterized protein O3C94_010380 [Discoglossus pictus]
MYLRVFYIFCLVSPASTAYSQYIYVKQSLTWMEALSYCRSQYTDLVSTLTDIELFSATATASFTDVWIGLYLCSPGVWRWSNGASGTYTKWNSGEPSQIGNACVRISASKWSDADCDSHYYFLCYKLANTTVPDLPSTCQWPTIATAPQPTTIASLDLTRVTNMFGMGITQGGNNQEQNEPNNNPTPGPQTGFATPKPNLQMTTISEDSTESFDLSSESIELDTTSKFNSTTSVASSFSTAPSSTSVVPNPSVIPLNSVIPSTIKVPTTTLVPGISAAPILSGLLSVNPSTATARSPYVSLSSSVTAPTSMSLSTSVSSNTLMYSRTSVTKNQDTSVSSKTESFSTLVNESASGNESNVSIPGSFYVVLTPLTWRQSLSNCRRLSTELAAISSPEEQMKMSILLSSYTPGIGFWVGLKWNRFWGHWYWSGGQPWSSFSAWGPGEPQTPLTHTCGLISGDPARNMTWSTKCCGVKLPSVCYKGL